MKEYSSDQIRNVAVVSHDGAGKTALVESLLLTSGAVDFVGRGQDNKHIMDFEPEEIKRNVTIQLGMAPCEWHDHKVNFIDTPGYNEFHGEVRAALRACDGMLMVLSATTGVETDTVRAWDYAVELQMPRMAFINKMDVDGADFFGTIERMRELFGKAIMPLQIPIGEGANFEGVIDVAKMTAFTYKDGQPTEIAVPAHLIEKAQEIREMTVEAAAEGSDELLEKYRRRRTFIRRNSSRSTRRDDYRPCVSNHVWQRHIPYWLRSSLRQNDSVYARCSKKSDDC